MVSPTERTSEKRVVDMESGQLHPGEMLPMHEQSVAPARQVPACIRRLPRSDAADSGNDESSLFYDGSRVPMKVIEARNPEVQGFDRHPGGRVDQLTPWLWKEHFPQQRLRSQIEQHARTPLGERLRIISKQRRHKTGSLEGEKQRAPPILTLDHA